MPKELLKRSLGQSYPLFVSYFRATATRSFRGAVDMGRLLHLFPRPKSVSVSPKRFLVISLTHHIGDTVMLLPMLEQLRRANPEATIECAVEEILAPFFRMIPVVDCVHGLELGGRLPANWRMALRRTWRITREYWRTMRRLDVPDTCIVPRWQDDLFRDRALAYLVGAKRSIGFRSTVMGTARPAPYRDALLSEAYEGGNGSHESQRYCLLLARAGLAPEEHLETIPASPVKSLQHVAESVDWNELAERLGLRRGQRFAVIAPGASKPVRMWPLQRWLPVAGLLKKRKLSVVILSGPGDAAIARELYRPLEEDAILVAGVTTFIETVALLSHACLFLGNDSGPSHIAGALGTPTLTIFVSLRNSNPDGPSSVDRIHPLGPRTAFCTPAECVPPCRDFCVATTAHCIANVTEEEVLRESERLLKGQEHPQEAQQTGSPDGSTLLPSS